MSQQAVAVSFTDHGAPFAGAPVVILSGSLGSNRTMWQPQLPALTPFARVIAYDQRGHGQSPVPVGPTTIDDVAGDCLALMDHLDIDRAHIVGLSMGGMVAQWLGAFTPQRVTSLSILCSAAHMPSPDPWLERAAAVRASGTASIAETVVSRWVTPDFSDRRVIDQLIDMVSATSDEGYAQCCEAIAQMDLRPALASITAPTLVIAASEDPGTPPETHVKPIADGISGSRFEIIEHAAHVANVEQPESINSLLIDHMQLG